eukprot:474308-Prymnesium_polylepis.1
MAARDVCARDGSPQVMHELELAMHGARQLKHAPRRQPVVVRGRQPVLRQQRGEEGAGCHASECRAHAAQAVHVPWRPVGHEARVPEQDAPRSRPSGDVGSVPWLARGDLACTRHRHRLVMHVQCNHPADVL